MVKRYIILLGFLLSTFAPLQVVKAEAVSEAEEMYITTEDIISDIVFPSIDKRVMKEYGGNAATFGWQWKRIVGIDYNRDHSYDVSIRIQVPDHSSKPFDYVEDLVKVKISPSCDSPKIGCNHDFKIEILDYKHLSK
jgi:hypothetical protein